MKKAILTIATAVGLISAQERSLPPEWEWPPDLSRYHLSHCAEGAIVNGVFWLSGLADENQTLEYNRYLSTPAEVTIADFKCLCAGGDGEGSAIMSEAFQVDWLRRECGWEHIFDKVFPEVRNFCRTILSEDSTATATAPTHRRRRALKQPPPQPNIALFTTEELPDTST